jgi:hypothetical protein
MTRALHEQAVALLREGLRCLCTVFPKVKVETGYAHTQGVSSLKAALTLPLSNPHLIPAFGLVTPWYPESADAPQPDGSISAFVFFKGTTNPHKRGLLVKPEPLRSTGDVHGWVSWATEEAKRARKGKFAGSVEEGQGQPGKDHLLVSLPWVYEVLTNHFVFHDHPSRVTPRHDNHRPTLRDFSYTPGSNTIDMAVSRQAPAEAFTINALRLGAEHDTPCLLTGTGGTSILDPTSINGFVDRLRKAPSAPHSVLEVLEGI